MHYLRMNMNTFTHINMNTFIPVNEQDYVHIYDASMNKNRQIDMNISAFISVI